MTVKVYGIKNCDTVKKSLKWLEANEIEFEFIDFKKESPSEKLIQSWLAQLDLFEVINKRGTTWRKLDDKTKSQTEATQLISVILENSSLIKRPVLDINGAYSVGFNAEDWSEKFA